MSLATANKALHLTGPASRFFETSRSLPLARQVNAVVRRHEVNLATDQNDDERRLGQWLAGFGGPVAPPQTPEERKRLMAEMCGAGADRMFPLLVPVLTGPDSEARCAACEAVLRIDARRAIDLVLPLLNDPDSTVRWQASGCLHDLGDERAVEPLIRVLHRDADPQVRNTAAYALGGIGSPAAIPALLAALESDHELDELGHSTRSCAMTALDDILSTNETRIRFADGLCKMQQRPPDLERLKRLARETYEDWSKRQAELLKDWSSRESHGDGP